MWAWPCTIYFSLPMCNAKRKKNKEEENKWDLCARQICASSMHQCSITLSTIWTSDPITCARACLTLCVSVCVCHYKYCNSPSLHWLKWYARRVNGNYLSRWKSVYNTLPCHAVPMIECVYLISFVLVCLQMRWPIPSSLILTRYHTNLYWIVQ